MQLMHENAAQPLVQPDSSRYLKIWLQCRKTLPVQQYCPSHNWRYNARVLKAGHRREGHQASISEGAGDLINAIQVCFFRVIG
ncbi:hypothetical protein [Paraburkholderia acidiphila]|uniref:Uncharacterized protein n=1 Tax=Paraburkholderia acidiphila TaxID=2571747 RepID=A0A7Z2J8L7_9BURK|nr:hypothetical protein [Paraburkholderia acidiphila]QGZ55386.1 hypothetical protein FAZ97_10955 [Paraburkholderia acidiphila]